MKTLKDLFLEEVADMYDAERRIAQVLPELARAATSANLRNAFQAHFAETMNHARRLENIFKSFGVAPKSKKCHAVVGLVDEARFIANSNQNEPTINAALIFAVQKIEHYEIATFGTLREWAKLLDDQPAAMAFQEMLDQEFVANQTLTELAIAPDGEEAVSKTRNVLAWN